MTRDSKFHHRERLKLNRRNHWGRDLSAQPEILSRAVNTPKPCSCFMCGNARKHAGATLQERRAEPGINEGDE